MSKNLIIGLGSGRCGTYTLYHIMKSQEGASFTHERYELPWKADEFKGMGCVVSIFSRGGSVVGDTGFYWINYIPDIIEHAPYTKFICLKRNKKQVVDSFIKRSEGENWWTQASSKHWDRNDKLEMRVLMFPKYDLPKRKAIAEYYDEYYRIAWVWEQKYPHNFRVFDMESVLNTNEGQSSMMEFCGIEDPKLILGKRLNGSRDAAIEIRELSKFSKTDDIFSTTKCECGKDAVFQIAFCGWVMFSCDDCQAKTIKTIENALPNKKEG